MSSREAELIAGPEHAEARGTADRRAERREMVEMACILKMEMVASSDW
jgi:hypothetical protein